MVMVTGAVDAAGTNTSRLASLMVPLAAGDTLGWKVRHASATTQHITATFDLKFMDRLQLAGGDLGFGC